jgi:tetratricopeptide (TPR) repeat protein
MVLNSGIAGPQQSNWFYTGPDPETWRVSLAATETTGSLPTALAHAERLLAADPALAESQAREILRAVPSHPQARTLLAASLRLQGRLAEALDILAPLAAEQPKAAVVHLEHGLTLGGLGEGKRAIAAIARASSLSANYPEAWRDLGDQLILAGDNDHADDAYARHIKASTRDPKLLEAATSLGEGRLAVAERQLREILKIHPTDVGAIRMLAETGTRLGRYADAEKLLERCLELMPSFSAARHNYALVLHRQAKSKEALVHLDLLLTQYPNNPAYRTLKAAALASVGDYEGTAAIYEKLLRDQPAQARQWMSYGHALKTLGRSDSVIAAYRKSVELIPHLGEAWWSLANLKTFRFSDADVRIMRKQLERSDIAAEDRFHLHFALGKALEDAGHYEESFAHYEQGNSQRRASIAYDDATELKIVRSKAVFTTKFFAERENRGCPAPDPIFVLGMPRAGSTLTEQILASHSQVEGTMELPDITAIARKLGDHPKKVESGYPEVLQSLPLEAFAGLGQEYLDRTRIQRRLGRARFIDKMPNNFLHVGLIHLILPNAKIIDVRRHPLACCFSNYKQHFARGQLFSYDLAGMGRYYAGYVELMAHFDAVLPGRVHRVIYEDLVANPEAEVHRLLAYCGLDFEESCLRFYENQRPVRTASAEQVRQPIFRDSVDQWQRYESKLDPLKAALGDVLKYYPAPPPF